MKKIGLFGAVIISSIIFFFNTAHAATWPGLAGEFTDPVEPSSCGQKIKLNFLNANGVYQIFGYDISKGSSEIFVIIEGESASGVGDSGEIRYGAEVRNNNLHVFSSIVFNKKHRLQTEVKIRVISENESLINAFELRIVDYVSAKVLTCHYKRSGNDT